MKARFDELLPFYVNGTLGSAEQAWVESYLREHPTAESELQWLRSVQTTVQAEAVPAASEVGLERALQRIRAERKQAAPSTPQGLRGWFARLLSPQVLKPMLAGAMAVVALQAVVISSLITEREDTSPIRTTAPVGGFEHGPYVKLNFRPDAREADIRMLLTQVQGSLAAGPGQLGDYYIRVSQAQLADITTTLGASPIVEGLAVVDALPATP